MANEQKQLVHQIKPFLESEDKSAIRELLSNQRSSDIAEVVEFVDNEQRRIIFDAIDKPISAEVLEKVDLVTSNYETESEILIKASRKGFKVSEVPIRTIYGGESSNINRFTDTLRFIRLVFRIAVSFSHG